MFIVLGVGFVACVIGNVIQFLVEGRIRFILGRHKLDKKIDRLNAHYYSNVVKRVDMIVLLFWFVCIKDHFFNAFNLHGEFFYLNFAFVPRFII
jgi:hypothetical protein